jgi:VWFA-related protein
MGFAQNAPAGPDLSLALNVVVTDTSGKPFPGLEEQDFTLLDNKRPQKITSFEAVRGSNANQSPPAEVILLMDDINTGITNLAFERQQAEKFLGRDNGVLSHPVSLAFLSDAGLKLTNPSQDGKALTAQLNANPPGLRVISRNQGVYGAGERWQLSLNSLGQLIQAEGAKPGRKLVVWISPGWPILTGPNIQLSPKGRQEIFRNIVLLADNLRRADMTISSIDPIGAAGSPVRSVFYKEFGNGVKKADDAVYGNLALPVVAYQTGGRVLNSNDLANEIAAAVSDVDIYYVLKFQASRADAANQYHSIEVKIDKPGLAARTRTGYYAQP